MKLHQLSLKNFFQRKKRQSESDSDPDDESEYAPSKQKQMFSAPMSWTRVKDVHAADLSRLRIYDVEEDLKADKSLKQVRKQAVRERGELLFDPEDFREQADQLRVDDYKLGEDQLFAYAKLATTIRKRIRSRAAEAEPEEVEEEKEPAVTGSGPSPLPVKINPPKGGLIHAEVVARSYPASMKRKRRPLREISAATRLEIVRLATTTRHTCQELALLYNVKVQTIYNLKKDAKKDQRYFVNKKEKELRRTRATSAIVGAVADSIDRKETIWTLTQMQELVRARTSVPVPLHDVAKILKNEFNLSYRKIRRVPFQGNSDRCLVLRQLYARKMFQLYNDGYHVLNIDESWIPSEDFRRGCWSARGDVNSLPERSIGFKVNIIVAVSSEGKVWLALTQCNTDENVMQLFLSKLATCLTGTYGVQWREKMVVVMDGASYHRSADTRSSLQHFGMKVVLSAPYSYQTAACELFFAHFKRGNWNPGAVATGKR